MSKEISRFGWTWDHSTNWAPAVHGRQTIGTNRAYLKRPEVFLDDYVRLLDFLGRKKFSGLCVWGLIRESHGGVESAREIVRYGRERGVAVTPGVGLFTYGGAFYEGRHEYNLETFALQHPECVAVVTHAKYPEPLSFVRQKDGTVMPDLTNPYLKRTRPWIQLCPSKAEVLSWVKEAVAWVIETLQLDIIMLEGGDVFTCQCEKCLSRRKRTCDERVSLEDICAGYIPVVEYLHHHYPNVRIQCETYAAPGTVPPSSPASNGGFIPEDCLPMLEAIPEPAQLELAYNYIIPEEQLNLPVSISRRGLLRTEMGSQWRGPGWPHCCAKGIAMMCRACRRLNIPSISFFTEIPDSTPSHWINYKALEVFSKEDIPFEKFVERDIAPNLGGVNRALEFIRWASDPKCGETNEGVKFAREAGSDTGNEEEFLKWAWLARFIAEHGCSPLL